MIHQVLVSAGWTTESLAAHLGVPAAAMTDYLNGKVLMPGGLEASLAGLLGMDVASLGRLVGRQESLVPVDVPPALEAAVKRWFGDDVLISASTPAHDGKKGRRLRVKVMPATADAAVQAALAIASVEAAKERQTDIEGTLWANDIEVADIQVQSLTYPGLEVPILQVQPEHIQKLTLSRPQVEALAVGRWRPGIKARSLNKVFDRTLLDRVAAAAIITRLKEGQRVWPPAPLAKELKEPIRHILQDFEETSSKQTAQTVRQRRKAHPERQKGSTELAHKAQTPFKKPVRARGPRKRS